MRPKEPRHKPRMRSRRLLKSLGIEGGSKDKLKSRCGKHREACTKCVARESLRLDLYQSLMSIRVWNDLIEVNISNTIEINCGWD